MEHEFQPVVGIWEHQAGSLYTTYRVELRFVDLVMGGHPKDPNVIEAWLQTRVMGGDEVIRQRLVEALADIDVEVPTDATKEEIIAATKAIAATRTGQGFRQNADGLCLARYNVVAMLKESTAILYPYEAVKAGVPGSGCAWGKTRKAPRSFLAERVNVREFRIPLGRIEPDGTHMQIGHISGPKGKRSILAYVDYCVQPSITFTISSVDDAITAEQWQKILLCGQERGLSAMRSQGYGQFKVIGFDRL